MDIYEHKHQPAGPSSFTVDGLLTIHGVTQPEQLAVTIRTAGGHPEYLATVRIDRHAFGMKIVPLNPVIGNTADVTVDAILDEK
jgi:polyisoprenoid-binding protein YceI